MAGFKRDPEKNNAWRRRGVENYRARLRAAVEAGKREWARMKPKKRTASEFERIYGSKERVRAMKMRPCDGCGRPPTTSTPNENAHTEGGGMGRKAGWQTIVTLCPRCHRTGAASYHALGSADAYRRVHGKDLKALAARLAVEVLP